MGSVDDCFKKYGKTGGQENENQVEKQSQESQGWNPRAPCICWKNNQQKERKMKEAARRVAVLYETCYMLDGVSWWVYLLSLVA